MNNFIYEYLPKPLRQKVVVLTGAGLSAESGLATFRDDNGLWKNNDAEKLASVAGFEENPQAVLDFYNYRRKLLLGVEPNHAHKMLVELEKWYDVTILTQNVDNLHERAGSTHVIHLHGELTLVDYAHSKVPKFIIAPNSKEIPKGFEHIKQSATKRVDKLKEKLIKLI